MRLNDVGGTAAVANVMAVKLTRTVPSVRFLAVCL
jgi:hypothetical protein